VEHMKTDRTTNKDSSGAQLNMTDTEMLGMSHRDDQLDQAIILLSDKSKFF